MGPHLKTRNSRKSPEIARNSRKSPEIATNCQELAGIGQVFVSHGPAKVEIDGVLARERWIDDALGEILPSERPRGGENLPRVDTSLDTLEQLDRFTGSNGCSNGPDDPEIRLSAFDGDFVSQTRDSFRGAHGWEKRDKENKRIASVFLGSNIAILRGRGVKMEGCGRGFTSWQLPGRAPTTLPNPCDDRFCPHCTPRRNRKAWARFEAIQKAFPDERMRMMTLTHPGVQDMPLDDACAVQRKSKERLRRSKLFKDHVDGCVMVEEITRNPETGTWNPHIHVMYIGKYWPQDELQSHWEKCGGGIVDIRAGYDPRELFKYCVKTAGLAPEDLEEAALATHRKKLIQFYGAFRDIRPEEKETGPEREALEIARVHHPRAPEEELVYWLARSNYFIEHGIYPQGEVEASFDSKKAWPVQFERLHYMAFAAESPADDFTREYAKWTRGRLLDELRSRQLRNFERSRGVSKGAGL